VSGPSAVLLQAPTDPRWFAAAAGRWRELLLDHAQCEKKAASTALSLMFAYGEDSALTQRLSRLAREELRHFEQVQQMLRRHGVPATRLSPSRYGAGLRRAVRAEEPRRRLDLMLCGALIEARSHERFVGVAPLLPPALGEFYARLARAEERHAGLYLELAGAGPEVPERLQELATIEAALATAPDAEFRFHSGTPL
jgi:tRNA-(ms[2]io[6]A)-hydroxylase